VREGFRVVTTIKLSDKAVSFLDGPVREEFMRHHPHMKMTRVSRPFLVMNALNYYVKKRHSILDSLLCGDSK